MPVPLYIADAFTPVPTRGNPAAVCLLDAPRPDAWMQSVAAEMNLSETAFLLPEGDGYRLRWFTPAVEVSLCGHATLASAHILWESGALQPDQVARFYTLSGLLTARRAGGWIELDFPARQSEPAAPPPGLLEALGVQPVNVALSRGTHKATYLLELPDEGAVRAAAPDFARLYAVEDARAACVTSRSADPAFDFVSRFFAPRMGVNEDPVTGSVHCSLAPYWADRLGKLNFNAHQASKRGGDLRVTLAGERVLISGQAVTTLRGELAL